MQYHKETDQVKALDSTSTSTLIHLGLTSDAKIRKCREILSIMFCILMSLYIVTFMNVLLSNSFNICSLPWKKTLDLLGLALLFISSAIGLWCTRRYSATGLLFFSWILLNEVVCFILMFSLRFASGRKSTCTVSWTVQQNSDSQLTFTSIVVTASIVFYTIEAILNILTAIIAYHFVQLIREKKRYILQQV